MQHKFTTIFKSKLYKQQLWAGLLFILIIPLGLSTKYYTGPAAGWVNDSLGGVLYEVFFCLLFFIFWKNTTAIKIAALVFVFTCVLELMQLWHPVFLEIIRSNFFGRTIFGNSFNWFDFIYYIIGSGIGYFILKWLQKKGEYFKNTV